MEESSDGFESCPRKGRVMGYKAVICDGTLEEPLDSLTCAHCELLLRDAVQNCEGYRLCKCCWDHIKTIPGQVCSKCGVRADGDCYPDRYVCRHVKNLMVSCPLQSLGCSWQGKLQDREAHVEVCEVGVACPNYGCEELVARKDVEKHLDGCCYRLVVCEYCNFQLPFKQKEAHESVCERSLSSFSAPENSHRFPGSVLCQNTMNGSYLFSNTEVSLLHQKGNSGSEGMTSTTLPYSSSHRDQQVSFIPPSHAMEELPFETSAMGFFSSLAGVSPPRATWRKFELLHESIKNLKADYCRDMKHVKKQLEIFADSIQTISLQVKRQVDNEKLQIDNKLLNEENELLRKMLKIEEEIKVQPEEQTGMAASSDTSSSCSSSVPQTKPGVDSGLEANVGLPISSVKGSDGTFIWKIPEITRRARDATKKKVTFFYSPPFYAGSNGYKICIRAYLNGDGAGYQTHLSFFFVVMKGEYDNFLKWPFENKVSLALINQSHEKDIARSFKPPPDSSSFQCPKTDMNIASGFPQFAKLCVLEDPSYVKDDVMYIKCIVDTTKIFHP